MTAEPVVLSEAYLLARAQRGDAAAYEQIIRQYRGFVRLKASAYYLQGGDADDLIQEGLVGLYKAVRDYRGGAGSTFRTFAELCIQRQIITAVKTATRQKHSPLNDAIGLDHPAPGASHDDSTLADVIPIHGSDPLDELVGREEMLGYLTLLAYGLSELEHQAVVLHCFGGLSYEDIADQLETRPKRVDNAIQRARKKLADPSRRQHCVDALRRDDTEAELHAIETATRHVVTYIGRRTPTQTRGARTAHIARRAALAIYGPDAKVLSVIPRRIRPDGSECAPQGRPRQHGRQPIPVWRVALEIHPCL